MALQSSGAISIDDIRTELGVTTGSLNTLSNSVGFSTPHSMSEFYGYTSSVPNDLYWDFAEGQAVSFSGSAPTAPTDFSFSFWIRPEWANSDTNVLLFEINANNGNNSDRLMLIYDFGFNRLVLRNRSGTSNYHINWALNQNSAAGNISRWHSGSRGPVNSDGFAHIAGTMDPTQSLARNGLKLYWNGVAFGTTITESNSAPSSFSKTHMYINQAFNGNGDRDASYDNIAFWFNRLLTSSEVGTLYNGGTPITATDAGLSTGLNFQADMESGTFADLTGNWSSISSTGQSGSY